MEWTLAVVDKVACDRNNREMVVLKRSAPQRKEPTPGSPSLDLRKDIVFSGSLNPALLLPACAPDRGPSLRHGLCD